MVVNRVKSTNNVDIVLEPRSTREIVTIIVFFLLMFRCLKQALLPIHYWDITASRGYSPVSNKSFL